MAVFRVCEQDGNGKLSRAEWRLDKKEHDVGDFGAGIDEVFSSTVSPTDSRRRACVA